jgi:amino acid transporter
MKRSLRLFDVLCLGLNAIVGSGIFLLPDDLYREMGALSPLAFLLCGLGLGPVAACYAVAAKNHDQTGGPYLYAREAFGALPAFVVGFMAFVTGVLSFAAVSAAAAAAVGRLIPTWSGPWGLWASAAGGIVFFSALNYRGARPGALTIDSFTIAKFGMLAVLVVTLVPSLGMTVPTSGLPRGASGIGAAVFMAVFAAQGFEVVGVPAGESHNPRRHVPLAILGSLFLATALYVLVQFVLVRSYAELGTISDTPLADAVLSRNQALGLLVAIGGLVSTWGFVAGTALGTPRYLFALSRGGHLTEKLAKLHPRFHSPSSAIVLTAILALLLVSSFDYRSLIGMSNVTIAIQYLTTCLAVAKLQRGPTGAHYHLPGGPLLPLMGSMMSVWIFSEASLEELGWVAITLTVGGGLLWLSSRARNSSAPRSP